MRYQVLMLDAPTEYYHGLRHRFSGMDVNFTMALTVRDAAQLCAEQAFHLIVLGLANCVVICELLISLRRVNFAPVVVLMELYDIETAREALQSGADLCLETGWPADLAMDHIMAQFRRHTSYIVDNVTDRLTFGAAFANVQRHDACGCHDGILPS